MEGVTIVGELLRADAVLLALVPAPRIKAGRLPEGSPLPAIALRCISVIERITLKRGTRVRFVERVQVSVRAASYRDQVAIIRHVVRTCSGQTGDLSGATGVSIINAGAGPDLDGPGDSFEQAQDFRVSAEVDA